MCHSMIVVQLHEKLDDCDFICRVSMDAKTIRTRLQELAFLNSKATIWFKASSGGQLSHNGNGVAARTAPEEGWEELHYSGGLREYVQHLNKDSSPMHEPIFIQDEVRQSALFTIECNMHSNSTCQVLPSYNAHHLPQSQSQKLPKLCVWGLIP